MGGGSHDSLAPGGSCPSRPDGGSDAPSRSGGQGSGPGRQGPHGSSCQGRGDRAQPPGAGPPWGADGAFHPGPPAAQRQRPSEGQDSGHEWVAGLRHRGAGWRDGEGSCGGRPQGLVPGPGRQCLGYGGTRPAAESDSHRGTRGHLQEPGSGGPHDYFIVDTLDIDMVSEPYILEVTRGQRSPQPALRVQEAAGAARP